MMFCSRVGQSYQLLCASLTVWVVESLVGVPLLLIYIEGHTHPGIPLLLAYIEDNTHPGSTFLYHTSGIVFHSYSPLYTCPQTCTLEVLQSIRGNMARSIMCTRSSRTHSRHRH